MGSVSEKEIKKLCMRNGRYCAICHNELIIDNQDIQNETIIAEITHIKGKKPGSARYDASMTEKERNSCENLLLLCANCHKMVDDQPVTYTIQRLYQIKKDYEDWIDQRIRVAIVDVSFAELVVVTKYLVSGQATPTEKYNIIPPKDKIKKNNLSQRTEHLIIMGMTQVKQVAEFIDSCLDVDFGERLKGRFVIEYNRLLKKENLEGDDLFNSLFDFASLGSNEFKQRAAGLAVLVYLFEKCEVFET